MSAELTKTAGVDPDDAVKLYLKDPEWMFKSAVGGVMNASALVLVVLYRDMPLFIPLCFCLWAVNVGFTLRTIRSKIADPSGLLPKWNEWQDLFISGMSWLAVKTFFSITAGAFSMGCLLIALVIGSQQLPDWAFTTLTVCTVCGIILFNLFVDLLLSVTMANFAQEENMMAAFAYGKVFQRFFKRPGNFLSAWLLGLGIQWLRSEERRVGKE